MQIGYSPRVVRRQNIRKNQTVCDGKQTDSRTDRQTDRQAVEKNRQKFSGNARNMEMNRICASCASTVKSKHAVFNPR